MKFLIKIMLEIAITKAEEQNGWGQSSRKEFLTLVRDALKNKDINDKTAFDFTMRAMAIADD